MHTQPSKRQRLRAILNKTFRLNHRLGRVLLGMGVGVMLSLLLAFGGAANPNLSQSISLKVQQQVVGLTTQYIGACEGNVDFNRRDLEDLGVNTYRIYGGMSRWEAEDDDGVYGWPSIKAIQNNPNLINWSRWDQVMTQPTQNSDYSFSGEGPELWQGNARTLFQTLKQANIRPVVTLRNTDPGRSPSWAANPPRSEADWNEWWEHVFATVYWLNVRNDYHVDDFEIHNEPDNTEQGWRGSQTDYLKFAQVTRDAIASVYATYLPERAFHLHAPKTVGGSRWPHRLIQQSPDSFDIVNIHNYDADISSYIRQVRAWMRGAKHHLSQLWLGEWGTYTNGYDDLDFSLSLIQNMIRMSEPGDTHVDGSHLFSLYDWGETGGFEGLINAKGDRRLSYYAFRMATRALQGGKAIYASSSSNSDLQTITTQVSPEQLYILMVNPNQQLYQASLDLSIHLKSGQITQWEFSQEIQDEVISQQTINNGKIAVKVPPQSASLSKLTGYKYDAQRPYCSAIVPDGLDWN